jgi:hypothetical protein
MSHVERRGVTLVIFGAIAPKGEGPSRGKPVPAVEDTWVAFSRINWGPLHLRTRDEAFEVTSAP